MKKLSLRIAAAAVALMLLMLPLAAMAENAPDQNDAGEETTLILPSENSDAPDQAQGEMPAPPDGSTPGQMPDQNGQMQGQAPGFNGQMPGQMPGSNGQMPGMNDENGGLTIQDGDGDQTGSEQFAFRDGRGERRRDGENGTADGECPYCKNRTLRIALTAGGAVLLAAGAAGVTAAIMSRRAKKRESAIALSENEAAETPEAAVKTEPEE